MRRSSVLAIALIGGVVAATGVTAPADAEVRSAAAPKVAAGSLKADIDHILADSRLNGASIGVVVRNAKSGAVLYSRDGEQAEDTRL